MAGGAVAGLVMAFYAANVTLDISTRRCKAATDDGVRAECMADIDGLRYAFLWALGAAPFAAGAAAGALSRRNQAREKVAPGP